MARIEPVGGGGGVPGAVIVIPFFGVAEVDILHGLGRLPVVQVLMETAGGIFGIGGFGGGGFGSSVYYVPMEETNFTLYHLDTTTMKLVMNNYYNGQVLYV